MKRKGRKSKKESTSNGVNAEEQRQEENGEASDKEVTRRDSEEREEKEKKRKTSGKRKSSSSKRSEVAEAKDDSHDEDQEARADSEEPEEKKKKTGRKEKKASSRKAEISDSRDEEDEPQYEVEQVLEEKFIRGIRHYLIRWKGYEPESDTWEPENTLSCDELINEFKKQKKNKGKAKSPKRKQKGGDSAKWDENEDFEVERILDVYFRKNGKREFLVSWKGYPHSANSWEPEDNMDCKDLIKRYMDRVDRAKETEPRELRLNRLHTDRLTLHTDVRGRRLSRRVVGKQRVRYHNAE